MFIDRDQGGAITGFAGVRQYEGQEQIGEDHPDWIAYLLAGAKREKIMAVSAELHRRMSDGFTHGGKAFQLDDLSQMRIAALALKAERVVAGREGATWEEGFAFIAADNT